MKNIRDSEVCYFEVGVQGGGCEVYCLANCVGWDEVIVAVH